MIALNISLKFWSASAHMIAYDLVFTEGPHVGAWPSLWCWGGRASEMQGLCKTVQPQRWYLRRDHCWSQGRGAPGTMSRQKARSAVTVASLPVSPMTSSYTAITATLSAMRPSPGPSRMQHLSREPRNSELSKSRLFRQHYSALHIVLDSKWTKSRCGFVFIILCYWIAASVRSSMSHF